MKKLTLLIAMFFALNSCSDYIEVNDDQSNNASNSDLTPSVMFAGSVNTYINYQNINLSDFGNRGAYAWGLNTGFTSTEPLYSYQFTSNDYSSLFNTGFLSADNFQNIIDRESKFPQYSYHYAAARIFKVMCMDYITALYGDIPYSQAFDLEKYSAPKYDDDKTIIPKLFEELKIARDLFANPALGVVSFGSEDIVFGGDISKWQDFLNTVELRLLLRLSKTTDPALVALRTQKFASLPLSFISYDVSVNPGYNSSTLGQRTPVTRVWGLNEALTGWLSANRALAPGDFFGKLLNGQLNTPTLISTGAIDPRRSRIGTLVGGQIVGNVQGTFPTTAISRPPSFFTGYASATGVFNDAYANMNSRDSFLMLNAESQFLQAEAIQRGYISGNAQTAFDSGILASFDFYSTGWGDLRGVISAVPSSTYLTQIANKQGLGWAGSTDKINCIMTQKYIALANWHGIELYIGHLRTGYPALPLPVGAMQTNRPLRLIYPNTEYTSNSQNVPNVINTDLYSVNNKTPYYLQ